MVSFIRAWMRNIQMVWARAFFSYMIHILLHSIFTLNQQQGEVCFPSLCYLCIQALTVCLNRSKFGCQVQNGINIPTKAMCMNASFTGTFLPSVYQGRSECAHMCVCRFLMTRAQIEHTCVYILVKGTIVRRCTHLLSSALFLQKKKV